MLKDDKRTLTTPLLSFFSQLAKHAAQDENQL